MSQHHQGPADYLAEGVVDGLRPNNLSLTPQAYSRPDYNFPWLQYYHPTIPSEYLGHSDLLQRPGPSRASSQWNFSAATMLVDHQVPPSTLSMQESVRAEEQAPTSPSPREVRYRPLRSQQALALASDSNFPEEPSPRQPDPPPQISTWSGSMPSLALSSADDDANDIFARLELRLTPDGDLYMTDRLTGRSRWADALEVGQQSITSRHECGEMATIQQQLDPVGSSPPPALPPRQSTPAVLDGPEVPQSYLIPGQAASRRRRIRATQACDACRKRKAKCDEARPSCTACIKNEFACTYGELPISREDVQWLQILHTLNKMDSNVEKLCSAFSADNLRHMMDRGLVSI